VKQFTISTIVEIQLKIERITIDVTTQFSYEISAVFMFNEKEYSVFLVSAQSVDFAIKLAKEALDDEVNWLRNTKFLLC